MDELEMDWCHVCGEPVRGEDEGLLLAPSGIQTVHRWCAERVKGNPEWIASRADVERIMERIEQRIQNG